VCNETCKNDTTIEEFQLHRPTNYSRDGGYKEYNVFKSRFFTRLHCVTSRRSIFQLRIRNNLCLTKSGESNAKMATRNL
jgi:hypothetical protein